MNTLPRYIYTENFSAFEDYFFDQPHRKKHFASGEALWQLGRGVEAIYYIRSGIAKVQLVHENGSRKLLYFVGKGSIYPGCHQSGFKIEQSIEALAVSEIEALEFDRSVFLSMLAESTDLCLAELDMYAKFINLHLYESAHQDYNNAFTKLCNLLYLFTYANGEPVDRINLTQQELADMLTLNRENV